MHLGHARHTERRATSVHRTSPAPKTTCYTNGLAALLRGLISNSRDVHPNARSSRQRPRLHARSYLCKKGGAAGPAAPGRCTTPTFCAPALSHKVPADVRPPHCSASWAFSPPRRGDSSPAHNAAGGLAPLSLPSAALASLLLLFIF